MQWNDQIADFEVLRRKTDSTGLINNLTPKTFDFSHGIENGKNMLTEPIEFGGSFKYDKNGSPFTLRKVKKRKTNRISDDSSTSSELFK